MGEREPRKETINKGELFFLSHPGEETIFSGFGLTLQPDRMGYLDGLLMVDRSPPPLHPLLPCPLTGAHRGSTTGQGNPMGAGGRESTGAVAHMSHGALGVSPVAQGHNSNTV